VVAVRRPEPRSIGYPLRAVLGAPSVHGNHENVFHRAAIASPAHDRLR